MAGHPPRGRPPTTPAACSPHRACKPRGRCWAPTPTHPRPQHVGGGPPQPAEWAGSPGRDGAWPQTPPLMEEGTPPGTPFRHPHSEQRRPASAHAVGPVLGPHARTDRTRDTRVAEPWLPAPEDGRPGEGQRLTTGAPHNGGRPPPPGTAPHHPRGMQPPQGMQAKWTVLGPHTHTPAPTARGWRTATAGPVPSPGRPSSGAGSQDSASGGSRVRSVRAWGPSTGTTACALAGRRCSLWGWWKGIPGGGAFHHCEGRLRSGAVPPPTARPTPLSMVEGTPPGDALPPPPQRATPARKGARCGAGAGSPRPHRPHPTHTGRGTLAARSRGRAAGGGTAPDTRRPSQRRQAIPPGDGPPTTPAARSPHRACRPRGQCSAPTPTHRRPQHVGGGPQQPAQWAGSRGRDSA